MKDKQGETEVYVPVVKLQEHCSQVIHSFIQSLDLQEAILRDKTKILFHVLSILRNGKANVKEEGDRHRTKKEVLHGSRILGKNTVRVYI